MEEAKRKIRFCLTAVVLAAVIVGVLYYVSELKGKKAMSEGTLVRQRVEQDVAYG